MFAPVALPRALQEEGPRAALSRKLPAAIPALEAGLKVVLCEKGKVLDHCGSIGCGVDHYLTVMDTGPEWDSPGYLIRHVPELTDYIVDMAVAGRVIREMPRIFRKLESFGIDFKARAWCSGKGMHSS